MCVGIARSWCETCRNSPDCMSGSSCMCNQSIVSLMDDEVARPPLWGRRRKRKRKQLSCFSFDRESINDRDRSNVYVCARSIRCVQPLVLRPAARRRRLAISPFGPRRGSCPFPLASWPASVRKAPGTNPEAWERASDSSADCLFSLRANKENVRLADKMRLRPSAEARVKRETREARASELTSCRTLSFLRSVRRLHSTTMRPCDSRGL